MRLTGEEMRKQMQYDEAGIGVDIWGPMYEAQKVEDKYWEEQELIQQMRDGGYDDDEIEEELDRIAAEEAMWEEA